MQERPIITQKMKSLVLTMSCFPHCGNLDTFILCGSFDIFENRENNCKADISLSVNFPEMLYLFFSSLHVQKACGVFYFMTGENYAEHSLACRLLLQRLNCFASCQVHGVHRGRRRRWRWGKSSVAQQRCWNTPEGQFATTWDWECAVISLS